MSRKTRFLVGLTAAALTFGGLFATMGSEKMNSCHPCHHTHHCFMQEENSKCDKASTSDKSKVDETVKPAMATDSVK